MKRLLLGLILITTTVSTGLAQKPTQRPKKVVQPARTAKLAVAFFDAERLRRPGGQETLNDFEYYFKQIQGIVARDFPNVELKILQKGKLLHLPDGTNLNVQNMRPELGYALAASGKKSRTLTGVQTDA